MVKRTLWSFLQERYTPLDAIPQVDLKGKTVMVTGANTGLGYETVKHFARMGPSRLILACRNEQKGLDAVSAIEKETGYKTELKFVDLCDFSSVISLAASLEGEPVDILVENAGVLTVGYIPTKDGWEEQLQVNYLSNALLAFLLLPNLQKAATEHGTPSRLVLVTSESHHNAKFDQELIAASGILKKLNDKEYCIPSVMRRRHYESKLLEILFVRAFAEHLAKSDQIIATSVNPGFCISGIRRNLSGMASVGGSALEVLVARTAEDGARPSVWAAVTPASPDLNGAYCSPCKISEPSDFVISEEGRAVQERVWVETIELLKQLAPAMGDIVRSHFVRS